MFSSVLLVLAAVSPAFATMFLTHPTAQETWTANTQQTIAWEDDGKAPSLQAFGPSKVSVYVGNVNQQTLVQSISDSVDVSTTSSIVFTPDASKGENGQWYFIRVESLNAKDPNNAQFPALAFSAKYTMAGMTGAFTADVKAQINSDGSSSSANAAPAATTTPTTSSHASTGTSKASGTTSGSSTPSAAGNTKDNGAVSVPFSAITCAAGVLVVVFSAMLM